MDITFRNVEMLGMKHGISVERDLSAALETSFEDGEAKEQRLG